MIGMMVCPHDTARNPERWFMVSQYLSAHAGVSVHLGLSLDFKEFHDKFMESGLIYANPNDSLRLMEEAGYLPLAKPGNLYDEVVFIAAENQASPSFESLRGARVAGVPSMFPTNLALSLLQARGIAPGSVEDCGSWMSAVRDVAQGKYDFGFIYKDFFDDLSGLTRGKIQVFFHSEERAAFHMLLLHPDFRDQAQPLRDALLTMGDDPHGASVLEGLNISQWQPIEEPNIERMKDIRRLAA